MKNFRMHKKRFLITALAALVFVAVISEVAHIFLKEETDRPPETIVISIPAGTAERISAGEAVPSIPRDLKFVIGDTLKVVNKDDVPHELGPLWIPAGSSASLLMEDANKYTLGCSFQLSRYFNFDVRSRTTASSRLQALALATPPTLVFFFLYSYLVFPLKDKDKKENIEDSSSASE